MKNINELKKEVKELVIALLKCKPTKDKEIIDLNVRAFMGGFEDYLSNQSVRPSIENLSAYMRGITLNTYQKHDALCEWDNLLKWMRNTPTPKKEESYNSEIMDKVDKAVFEAREELLREAIKCIHLNTNMNAHCSETIANLRKALTPPIKEQTKERENKCVTCEFSNNYIDKQPCNYCTDFNHYKPKKQPNLQKELKDKEEKKCECVNPIPQATLSHACQNCHKILREYSFKK